MKGLMNTLNTRPTCDPRKAFEWPSQYFLKASLPSILAEIEDRFDVKIPFFLFHFKFLRLLLFWDKKW